MSKSRNKIKAERKVDLYETTAPLLESLYQEVQTLSKKKPDGTLNQNKVTLINPDIVTYSHLVAIFFDTD